MSWGAIAGAGAISSTGWRVDAETGFPVYPIDTLPPHTAIKRFAERYRPDRAALLGLHAADRAITQAGWGGGDFAIIVGGSRGPTHAWEKAFGTFTRKEPLPPTSSPRTTLGSLGFTLADYFGTKSLASSLSVTCSSGFHALLHGTALLRAGLVNRVLVGGAEASLTTFTLRQMQALGVYAPPPGPGDFPCHPLSPHPPGMVIGEGAAFLALTTEALERTPQLLGIGFARESGRGRSGISPGGEALQASMRMALASPPRRPDRIVVHAPGTPKGDAAERAAIRAVLGPGHPPLTSFKAATGHTFGASGPLALVQGLQRFPGEKLLVNATGFGGNAVSVLVG